MKKKILQYISVVLICVLFTACANSEPIGECLIGEPSGFFSGFWHGFTIVFSLIGSAFDSDITIYAINNTGFGYDIGYFLGVGGLSTLLGRR